MDANRQRDLWIVGKVLTQIYLSGSNNNNGTSSSSLSLPLDKLQVAGVKKKELLEVLLQASLRVSVSQAAEQRVRIVPRSVRGHPSLSQYSRLVLFLVSHVLPQPLPSWPESFKTLKVQAKAFCGDATVADVFFADVLYFGYASLHQGETLIWNSNHVHELATTLVPPTTALLGGLPPTASTTTLKTPPPPNHFTSATGTSSSAPLDYPSKKNSQYSATTAAPNGKKHSPPGLTTTTTQRSTGGSSAATNKEWFTNEGQKCVYVDTVAQLEHVVRTDVLFDASSHFSSAVAVQCHGAAALDWVCVGRATALYVFDGKLVGASELCRLALRPLFSAPSLLKVVHDQSGGALSRQLLLPQQGTTDDDGPVLLLQNVLDTKLIAEHDHGEFDVGLGRFLELMDLGGSSSTTSRSKALSGKRPFSPAQLKAAVAEVSVLARGLDFILRRCSVTDRKLLQDASLARLQNAAGTVCFDAAHNYRMATPELLRRVRPDDGIFGRVPTVESEVDEVIHLLPEEFQYKFVLGKHEDKLGTSDIRDIDLDIGADAVCWIHGKRVWLCEDCPVEQHHVDDIIRCVGTIGKDNRAGLDGTLHRFSVLRDRNNDITGLTIRIGRNVTGSADLIMDYILGQAEASILFLGEPGSGKTTVVREATRLLAEERRVMVVDTSNEIGGDGTKPHRCIGLARRMMVKSLDEQSAVMIECVQNHTPNTMVIDEIGRPKEVEAARTVRQRGVRVIASAHGDLRKLIKNKELCGLVGGTETVTLGDSMAKQEAQRKGSADAVVANKSQQQRRGEPTFDVVVELHSGGRFHEWNIVSNVAQAVDSILDGGKYTAERRIRNATTGAMSRHVVHL